MSNSNSIDRRTVLKGIGAGVTGSTAFAGGVSAGDSGDERRQNSFAWADGDLYEMLEPEPPGVHDLEPGQIDEEGAHEAHRPIWIISSMAGTGVQGSDHSPHPNPDGLPIDHVVPLVNFSAQWHITLVTTDPTAPFANLTNRVDGTYLTSANAIRSAEGAGDIHTIPLFTPAGDPAVFTCPIRPHQHRG